MNRILKEDLDYIVDSFGFQDEFRNATFLVTGATGLVGSVFVKALAALEEKYSLGMRVIAVIRNKEKAAEMFQDIAGKDMLTYYTGDITAPDFYDSLMAEFPELTLTYIVHGASVTASKQMVENPVGTIDTAIMSTKNMLETANAQKVKNMVYLSSMEMYGSVDKEKVEETDLGYINLANVRSCYPESKRMCECMCNSYAKQLDVNVCSARLAQTFGPGIPKTENRIFAQFARSIIRGQDIVLHTRGLSEGNYCYIRDMLQGLLVLLVKGAKGEAYNVVNEECHTTISAMAEMACNELAQGKVKVVYDIPEDMATYGYAPDVKLFLSADKLRSLGWEPQINLKEAYQRLISYIKINEDM